MSTTREKKERRPRGPLVLEGSARAKQLGAAVLEVLSGIRSPASACEALGLALSRYYTLEVRALQGLITALEPRPRGRQRTGEAELIQLQHDKERLEREVARSQALVRTAERAIGLPRLPTKPAKGGPGKKRKHQPRVRSMKAITVLRAGAAAGEASTDSDVA